MVVQRDQGDDERSESNGVGHVCDTNFHAVVSGVGLSMRVPAMQLGGEDQVSD